VCVCVCVCAPVVDFMRSIDQLRYSTKLHTLMIVEPQLMDSKDVLRIRNMFNVDTDGKYPHAPRTMLISSKITPHLEALGDCVMLSPWSRECLDQGGKWDRLTPEIAFKWSVYVLQRFLDPDPPHISVATMVAAFGRLFQRKDSSRSMVMDHILFWKHHYIEGIIIRLYELVKLNAPISSTCGHVLQLIFHYCFELQCPALIPYNAPNAVPKWNGFLHRLHCLRCNWFYELVVNHIKPKYESLSRVHVRYHDGGQEPRRARPSRDEDARVDCWAWLAGNVKEHSMISRSLPQFSYIPAYCVKILSEVNGNRLIYNTSRLVCNLSNHPDIHHFGTRGNLSFLVAVCITSHPPHHPLPV
jgi:hypothetical protein